MIGSLANLGSGGLATRVGQSANRRLWAGCASLWAPCLMRSSQSNPSSRQQPLVDLGYRGMGARRSGGGSNNVTPFGYGLGFTGSGGGFFVANSTAAYNFIHQTAVFSLVVVVRSDNIAAIATLFDSTVLTSSSTGFSLYQDSAGKLSYFVTRAAAGFNVVGGSTSSSLSTGRWNTVVVSCDGTTGRIWLNGSRDGADATVGTLGSGSASYDLGIGCTGGGGNSSVLNGSIALLGIWNRPLNSADARLLTIDPLAMFRRNRSIQALPSHFKAWLARPGQLIGGIA